MESLCVQWPGGRVQRNACVARDYDFVIYAAAFASRTGQKMRGDFDAVSCLVLIDFYLIGVEHRRNYNLIVR